MFASDSVQIGNWKCGCGRERQPQGGAWLRDTAEPGTNREALRLTGTLPSAAWRVKRESWLAAPHFLVVAATNRRQAVPIAAPER